MSQTTQDALFSVPAYAALTGTQKEQADALLATLDWRDPESMKNIHATVMDALGQVTSELVNIMKSEPNGVFTSAIQNMKAKMDGLDLDALSHSVVDFANRGLQKGVNFVAKNKGASALVAFGAVTGGLVPAAAGAGWGVMNWARKRFSRDNGVAVTMEQLEDRIGNALVVIEGGCAELQLAYNRSPDLKKRMFALNSVNGDTFKRATLSLCVGREYLRHLDDEVIPDLQAAPRSMEGEEDLFTVEHSRSMLQNGLRVLENVRNESVNSTQILRELLKGVQTNEETVESLLTVEVAGWRRDLVTSGIALDTLKSVQVATAFRDHVEGMRDDAVAAAQLALQAVSDGRIDDPKRLERSIERTAKLQAVFAERMAQIEEREALVDGLRNRLEDQTGKLLQSLAEAAQPGRALPAPEAAGVARLAKPVRPANP